MLLFQCISSTIGPFSGVSGQCGAARVKGKSEQWWDPGQSAACWGRTADRVKILTFSSQLLGFAFHFNQFQMKLTSQDPWESWCPCHCPLAFGASVGQHLSWPDPASPRGGSIEGGLSDPHNSIAAYSLCQHGWTRQGFIPPVVFWSMFIILEICFTLKGSLAQW